MTIDLLSIVRAQLKRSRTLPNQLESVLALNVEDSLPGEASGPLLRMEEYEQELLLSRFFTPDNEDRAACEPALPVEGLSGAAMAALMETLVAETLSFRVEVGAKAGYCPIPEVVLTRYVRLLGLEVGVDGQVAKLLADFLSGHELALAMSLARRPVWRKMGAEGLLGRCLEVMGKHSLVTASKLDFLTGFVYSYHCVNERELCHGLDALVESYRIEFEHPTYNPRLETRQSESIRSRYSDDAVKQFRVAMAKEILADFRKNST